jgi:hypothetical protein
LLNGFAELASDIIKANGNMNLNFEQVHENLMMRKYRFNGQSFLLHTVSTFCMSISVSDPFNSNLDPGFLLNPGPNPNPSYYCKKSENLQSNFSF